MTAAFVRGARGQHPFPHCSVASSPGREGYMSCHPASSIVPDRVEGGGGPEAAAGVKTIGSLSHRASDGCIAKGARGTRGWERWLDGQGGEEEGRGWNMGFRRSSFCLARRRDGGKRPQSAVLGGGGRERKGRGKGERFGSKQTTTTTTTTLRRAKVRLGKRRGFPDDPPK
ncbi:hypothetical protein LX36DRAFT_442190 [Colletotrichum falcatum]|nr:hypothetical protein LX36DRAFT_442190 [Colletotrichum falcatum]